MLGILIALPLGALGAVLLDWTLVAGLLALAWVGAIVYYVGSGFAMDRKYGTWGSDHTLGP